VISFLWFACFGELTITQVGEGARVSEKILYCIAFDSK